MVVPSRSSRLILPIAPLCAGVTGVLTAGSFLLLPPALLESLVIDSGIAAVLSAAEPPLGLTARAVLALLCGGGVALIVWCAVFLLVGRRALALRRPRSSGGAPVLRRADAHPDAPSRPPVFAHRDLGTPFLDVRARPVHLAADAEPAIEARPLPDDLDQPLAAYATIVVPPEPAPLDRRQTFAPGERLETFALTAPVRDASATVQALLDRLERSVSRREPAMATGPRPESIDDTLSMLRERAVRRS